MLIYLHLNKVTQPEFITQITYLNQTRKKSARLICTNTNIYILHHLKYDTDLTSNSDYRLEERNVHFFLSY